MSRSLPRQERCLLPRNSCSFCGDDQLDQECHDKGALSTALDLMSIDRPGELCGGDDVEHEDLRRHCSIYAATSRGAIHVRSLCPWRGVRQSEDAVFGWVRAMTQVYAATRSTTPRKTGALARRRRVHDARGSASRNSVRRSVSRSPHPPREIATQVQSLGPRGGPPKLRSRFTRTRVHAPAGARRPVIVSAEVVARGRRAGARR